MIARKLLLAAVLAGVLIPLSASANDAFDVGEVISKQERVRRDAETGARGFSELTPDKRKEFMQRQSALLESLRGRTYAELDAQQRTQAAGEIAWLDGVVSEAADERLVCERLRTPGSNRVTRSCMSVRQLRERQEAASKQMRPPEITTQSPSYGGDGNR
ncbi:hypothetical protein QLQ15_06735 [Lysobacter sp. LF1]|uniref:Uncharacterized protein n=1 Tax=Lysobacter stagni TaxID=3045172 RepID=A0ABT6XFF8_9GAMM|nr:hypothetical protein [Lysobacter sp. LF1]MDI9238610.1 hypothetical protein [Lysobacter sp. LF1]